MVLSSHVKKKDLKIYGNLKRERCTYLFLIDKNIINYFIFQTELITDGILQIFYILYTKILYSISVVTIFLRDLQKLK